MHIIHGVLENTIGTATFFEVIQNVRRQKYATPQYSPTPIFTKRNVSYSWHPKSRNNKAAITTILGDYGMAGVREVINFPPSGNLLE